MSPYSEQALVFECAGESLVGVLALPNVPSERGVLVVVGGPQYRVGSHRQFTLLSRDLAAHGIPTLRFDYRGMGDSTGEVRNFEGIAEDIRCAIDALLANAPGLKEVVIWGLCDAASAALLYAHRDPRVTGLVLLNPWVRTEQSIARTQLRHYYGQRLFQRALWRKLLSGEFDLRASVASLVRTVAASLRRNDGAQSSAALPDRMLEGLRKFRAPILLILSGNDLTAQEFKDVVAGGPEWQALLGRRTVHKCELAQANHTFSRREWRDQVARWTLEWITHENSTGALGSRGAARS